MSNSNQIAPSGMVFIPMRYGQILGVYASQDDAMQLANVSIAKGHPCDVLVRPVIQPNFTKDE